MYNKLNILIVEDDLISSKVLNKILSTYGNCDIVTDGLQALEAFEKSIQKDNNFYNLICMDVMMKHMDGLSAVKKIRQIEENNNIPKKNETKIIMTTSLDNPKTIMDAYYNSGATSYLVKPIKHKKLISEIRRIGLI